MKKKVKTKIGIVTSDKMQKTIVLKVQHIVKHHAYSKMIKRYTKFKAHDEKNQAKAGDMVKIEETRPLSKDKRWRLAEILKTKIEGPRRALNFKK